LIIPTYSDHESNACRVAAAGAGDFVLPAAPAAGKVKRVNAAEVHAQVDHIPADSSCRENAKRISRKLRSDGGSAFAAAFIEDGV
jgi:UDP:flavonoid glycosyltransferase YjiC (YdhE family)